MLTAPATAVCETKRPAGVALGVLRRGTMRLAGRTSAARGRRVGLPPWLFYRNVWAARVGVTPAATTAPPPPTYYSLELQDCTEHSEAEELPWTVTASLSSF